MQSLATFPRQVCTFYVGGQAFGIDVQTVQEVVRSLEMTEVPLATECVQGLINLRGQIVTAVDLRVRLRIAPEDSDRLPMHVVIRTVDGPLSLLVDRVGDVHEITEDQMESPPDTLDLSFKGMITATVKRDHDLLLILDIDKVIQLN
jgi:purine-binding chemotaxis protein CheW